MLNRNNLLLAVRRIIISVTGISENLVFIGDPNEDVADMAVDDSDNPLTYITVNTGTIQQYGQAVINLAESSEVVIDPELGPINLIDHQTITNFNLSFSLNFFRGDDAYNFASAFDQANKRPSIVNVLRTEGMGWSRLSPTNDLTALQNSNYEQRYQRDLFLYVDNTINDTLNPIYRVPYEVENENAEILDTGEVILT